MILCSLVSKWVLCLVNSHFVHHKITYLIQLWLLWAYGQLIGNCALGSYCLVVTQAKHCIVFRMPICPMPNCQSNLYWIKCNSRFNYLNEIKNLYSIVFIKLPGNVFHSFVNFPCCYASSSVTINCLQRLAIACVHTSVEVSKNGLSSNWLTM